MEVNQIFKAKGSEPYVVIPNELVRRTDISFRAKGLLCYLLSLPSDWVVRKEQIMQEFNEGRDMINSIFNELEKVGYILGIEIRDKVSGKFIGKNFIVYYTPQINIGTSTVDAFAVDGKPVTGQPFTAKPHLQSKERTKYVKKKERSTYSVGSEQKSAQQISDEKEESDEVSNVGNTYHAIVETFYNKYPNIMRSKGIDYKSAQRAYNKISEHISKTDKDSVLHYFNILLDEINNTFLSKNPFTFHTITSENNLMILSNSYEMKKNGSFSPNTSNGKPVVKPLKELTDEDLWILTREDGKRLYPGDNLMYFNQLKRKYEQKIGIRDAMWGDLEPDWRSKFPNYPDNPSN